jgi:diguanylate cyclase (GGDEF)-like protein
MQLHVPTLAFVAVFVAAILGALLLLAWRRDENTNALGWWGAGYLLGGAAFGLLAARGEIPNVLSIEIANMLLLLGYSFLLAGTRAFAGRSMPVAGFLVAPLIWLTAMQVPAIAASLPARVLIVSGLQGTLVTLMAYELWRGRAEVLLSRWPTIILLTLQVAMLTVRMGIVTLTPIATHQDLFRSPIFAVMAFGTVLYTITFAFLLLSMAKERSELRHKIAALVDPLTGLPNRRAFMIDADAAIASRATRSEPLAVLLADLDHFKKINDVFGHAVGDQALRLFADTLQRSVGAHDLVGRLGGEEFVILAPGVGEEAAMALGERIRKSFAEVAVDVDARAVAATVSIGVAASRAGDLTGLLARADNALYQAKQGGRNRVAVFVASRGPQEVPAPAATVVPIRLRAAAG